jgi:hypothetical protein
VAQRQERRAMQADQKRDREVLGQLHKAERKEYWAGVQKRRTDLRQKAFEEAKQRNAKRWDAVRKIKNPEKRKRAAARVKGDKKHVHDAIRKKHLAGAPKVDNALQKALFKQQEQDRQELRAAHLKEQGLLARQHVAERLAASHQKLAENTHRAAARTSARMSNARGLAGQNKAAARVANDHARFRRITVNGETVPLPANPLEASRAYLKLAHAEHAKRGDLRQTLNQQRDARIASRQSALINAAGHGRADPQSATRQKAMSGQTLTDAERATASPEIKAQFDIGGRKATAARAILSPREFRQQAREQGGRSGGGRGR